MSLKALRLTLVVSGFYAWLQVPANTDIKAAMMAWVPDSHVGIHMELHVELLDWILGFWLWPLPSLGCYRR